MSIWIGILVIFAYLIVESRKGDDRALAYTEMEKAKMAHLESPDDVEAYKQFELWREVYLRVNGLTPISKIISHVKLSEFD